MVEVDKKIKGYKELKEYYDETFPTSAPHHIEVLSDREYKRYKEWMTNRLL